jgi:hypothetical protein
MISTGGGGWGQAGYGPVTCLTYWTRDWRTFAISTSVRQRKGIFCKTSEKHAAETRLPFRGERQMRAQDELSN